MNLASILIAKRREKGITQDELAAHVGISKASVSKWENGNSYPDITLLPLIASYFDISIDRLMNYSPQLSETEIKSTYDQLAEKFATTPFEDVISECEALVKKYYSCHPFVLQIALLYINHAQMAASDERKTKILESAIHLCRHAINNCRDIDLLHGAEQFQALCYLQMGDAEKVIELLCDKNLLPKEYGVGIGALVSQAHQMLGNMEKANEVEQIELFQGLCVIFAGLLSYIHLNLADFDTAQVAYERAVGLSEMFNMRRLDSNSTAILYALGAQMYMSEGKSDETITAIEKYVDVCIHGFFPFMPRGDSFFNRIDKWLAESMEKAPLPRSEAVVKESMLNDVLLDPAFDSLHGTPAFTNLVQKLRNFIGGQ
jgi:transcriptional regulator with XRE-family HTH domain